MAVDIKAPDFPESVEDGTLAAWHKQNGESVERDEKIADVETDKIVLEVYALESGTLEVLIEEGDTVERDAILARISGGSKKGSAKKKAAPKKAAAKQPAAPPPPPPKPAAPAPAPAASNGAAAAVALSPSVKKLVHEHGIDATQITGTGKDGRIVKKDVLAFIASGAGAASAAPAASAPAKAAPVEAQAGMRRVPMSRIRSRIAERLKEVQNTAAILTTFNEVDMKPVMDIRSRYKENFIAQYGVKLGFMSFFVKAAVEALKKYPAVNASVEGDEIVYHEYYNISIAVSSPRGLVVPVIRNADQMTFADIEREIRVLAEKAQNGKLTLEEMVGGTFTITNGGTFGSMLSTPILNAPQSAILGMHNIVKRPWVVGDEIAIRPIMYLAVSYDHRIVDGKEAVSFLVSIKESLEQPEKLLLQL